MNIEQIEGQLREYEGKTVAVSVPIRGTVHLSFYGPLSIQENWDAHNSFILYTIHYWPDADVCFRAQDVAVITPNPVPNVNAGILLKIEEHSGNVFS